MSRKNIKTEPKEFIAELLRERIYATFTLIAVLATIDTKHTDARHAAFIITGTIIALWAASIVATVMSRRMIFQNTLNHEHEIRHQIRVHAPMLLTLAFPLFLLLLTSLGVLSLSTAITVAIFSAMLLLVSWSIHSARSLHARKIPTLILIVLQVGIGLGIIALKIAVGH